MKWCILLMTPTNNKPCVFFRTPGQRECRISVWSLDIIWCVNVKWWINTTICFWNLLLFRPVLVLKDENQWSINWTSLFSRNALLASRSNWSIMERSSAFLGDINRTHWRYRLSRSYKLPHCLPPELTGA